MLASRRGRGIRSGHCDSVIAYRGLQLIGDDAAFSASYLSATYRTTDMTRLRPVQPLNGDHSKVRSRLTTVLPQGSARSSRGPAGPRDCLTFRTSHKQVVENRTEAACYCREALRESLYCRFGDISLSRMSAFLTAKRCFAMPSPPVEVRPDGIESRVHESATLQWHVCALVVSSNIAVRRALPCTLETLSTDAIVFHSDAG
jgi:hypothetical protein